MRRSLFLLLFIATCFNSVSVAALIQWKIEDGGNGHFYEAVSVSGGINWNDAMTGAAISGGYLATITSQTEQAFINNNVMSSVPSFNWSGYVGAYRIGGFQPPDSPEPDGNWQWITGEPFIYTNWYMGEPSGGGENTIVLWDGRQWNDGPANYLYSGYIVETVPEPATILILGLGGFMLRKK